MKNGDICRGSGKGPKSILNVTPLVDVALALLVILMVTKPVMMRSLPVEVHADNVVSDLPITPVSLKGMVDGTIEITDGASTPRKLVGRRGLVDLRCIVTPDTILRWYRQLVAAKYDGPRRRGPGRPRTVDELRALVVSMAVDNPSRGYTRLRDVLRTLGREIGRTTIQELLKEQGIEPAPCRKKQMSWSHFLRAHWGAIAAWDFLTVEVLTLRGLVRYHVLIVIDLASRSVEIGGIASEPTGAWMKQAVRNLLDREDGFLTGKTKLIMDRDPVFTNDVRTLLRTGGVEPVRLPARSPNLNAFAERFVLSIKSECLNKLILLGEGHLRLAVREYVAHYNGERPHQGLAGRFVVPPANENMTASIQCRERLGGLLRYYHRNAA